MAQPPTQPAAAVDAKPSASFARFFSSVEGHLVSRYGSASNTTAPVLLGAERKVQQLAPGPGQLERTAQEIVWDTSRVVAITPLEARRFRREYDEAVRTGALKERTAKDYDAWLETQAKADAAASAAKAKADADAAAKAEKDARAAAKATEQGGGGGVPPTA